MVDPAQRLGQHLHLDKPDMREYQQVLSQMSKDLYPQSALKKRKMQLSNEGAVSCSFIVMDEGSTMLVLKDVEYE